MAATAPDMESMFIVWKQEKRRGIEAKSISFTGKSQNITESPAGSYLQLIGQNTTTWPPLPAKEAGRATVSKHLSKAQNKIGTLLAKNEAVDIVWTASVDRSTWHSFGVGGFLLYSSSNIYQKFLHIPCVKHI